MQDRKDEAQNPRPQKPTTSPPQPMKQAGSKKWLILIAILVLAGAGIFLIVKGLSPSEPEPTPTPYEITEVPTVAPTQEPVDKSEIEIEVLNGTGIAKEASFLQGKLANLGYEQIEVGNADSQDYEETVVTFSSSVPDSAVEEITDELEDIYKEVRTSTSRSLEDVDIRIITGLRAGQTPKPETTPEPTASPSPSPTASPAATPTAAP